MTGLKIALAAVASVGGVTTIVTGGILANAPVISGDTPVNMTLVFVAGGISSTAIAAWKVSRAWSNMETRVAKAETEIASLKRHRAVCWHEKHTKLSHEQEREPEEVIDDV